MGQSVYYCEVCFALPLRQSFTYRYEPKPWKPPPPKRRGRQKTVAKEEKEQKPENPEPLFPEIGQRILASFGQRRKEGWIISVALQPCGALEQLIEAGKLRLDELKELEIVEARPLFGSRELHLARWLSQYYVCSLGQALNCILPTGKKEKEPLLCELGPEVSASRDLLDRPAQLSEEQKTAVATVCSSLEGGVAADPPFYYLFGPTGSGKTEVFLQCMAQVLAQGKGVIYLVPEISLCYQLREQLQRRFQQPVALLHSHLSAEMRLWYWRSLQQGRCRIVLGARSAVFAPLQELGLIILDEEHEQSYKAGDTPRYHARQVAMRRCRDHKSILLMGSATPSVEAMLCSDYLTSILANKAATDVEPGADERTALAQEDLAPMPSEIPEDLPDFIRRAWQSEREQNQASPKPVVAQRSPLDSKQPNIVAPGAAAERLNTAGTPSEFHSIELLRLSQRLAGGSFPEVEVIDLRRSKSILSEQLVREIELVSSCGDQVILFLNRRGYSPIVECFSCGKVQECPECSVALTYHKNSQRLKCHLCGFSMPLINTCNYCHKQDMEFVGFGTEQIEEELQRYFAHLRIARLDTDVSRRKGQSEKILQEFRAGELDLLVGTQMVAKGLNFERVKLVGVILADTSLNMPDFRAAERSFSLLVQVAGRAGRYSAGGKILIQTYQPQSEVIQKAATLDWEGFYRKEMQFRELAFYPPFSRIIRFVFRSADLGKLQIEAQHWYQGLQESLVAMRGLGQMELFAPCECPYSRVAGKYRYHMLLRISRQSFGVVHRCVQHYFWQARQNQRSARVYVEIDVDPMAMM